MGKKGLRRPDGSKLYSDEVHGEGLKVLARERNGVLAELERQTQEVRLAVASWIVRIENADPADAISPAELDRANLKRAFAPGAAEAFDAEAFGKRLGSGPSGGDRAPNFACWMAGQRKKVRWAPPLTGYLARRLGPGRGAPCRRDPGDEAQ